jgi:hypothetical protein
LMELLARESLTGFFFILGIGYFFWYIFHCVCAFGKNNNFLFWITLLI